MWRNSEDLDVLYREEKKRKALCPDTLGSSSAEDPQAPYGAPGMQVGASRATWRYHILGKPGLGMDWK